MMLDGNFDLYKEIKQLEMEKDEGKYVIIIFLFIIVLEDN